MQDETLMWRMTLQIRMCIWYYGVYDGKLPEGDLRRVKRPCRVPRGYDCAAILFLTGRIIDN